QKPNNPDTVRDWKLALDAIVKKQGTFNLVFHPHGWIKAEQIIELIDHAVAKHGKKVKFLTFKECAERLNRHLLQGKAIRNADGSQRQIDDSTNFGSRFVLKRDVDGDGSVDVISQDARGPTGQVTVWIRDKSRGESEYAFAFSAPQRVTRIDEQQRDAGFR